MLARTAENLFWMSRYMERIDFMTKVMLVGYASHTDFQAATINSFNWKIAAKIFYSNPADFQDNTTDPAKEVFRRLMMTDEYNSLRLLITRARENARGVQEHISKEVWESINKKYHYLINTDIESVIVNGHETDFLYNLFEDNLKYTGVIENTNHRGEGWNFMNLGKFCERSLLVLAISEEKYRDPNAFTEVSNNILFWKNFLLSISGFEFFIKDYRSADNSKNVLEMIIFNQEFTRSTSYTIQRMRNYIQNIIEENPNPYNEKIRKEIGMLSAKIKYSDVETIISEGLDHFFSDTKKRLYHLNQSIGQIFFLNY